MRSLEQKNSKMEKKLNSQIARMKDDMDHNEAMYREVLDQQEEEYENELQKLMSVAESDLITEQETTRKMQGIVQTLNTKRAQLKKKNEELKLKTANHELEYAKEKGRRVKLEGTLGHVELHMKEREDALSDKEKTILGLRSTNKTLDNFRYVLDHRLQQLMQERGPIQKHIEGLEKHVRAMYDELVGEFNKKKEIDRTLDKKQLKINTQEKEILSIRNNLRDREREIHSIKRDLTSMVGVSVAKELEELVKEAYRKFVRGEKIKKKVGGTGGVGSGGGGNGASTNMGSTKGSTMKSTNNAVSLAATGGGGGGDDEESVYSNDGRGGGGGGGIDGGYGGGGKLSDEIELTEKALEAQRQTRWVQKEAKDLKRRLGVEMKASQKDSANKLNENASLIKECNSLRRENVEMKRDKEALTHEINDMKERMRRKQMLRESRGGGGTAGTMGTANSTRLLNTPGKNQNQGIDTSSMMSQDSGFASNGPEDPQPQTPLMGTQMRISKSLAELEEGKAANNNNSNGNGMEWNDGYDEPSPGKVAKGSSARQTGKGITLRQEAITLQKKLDARQRETEMQRTEINRLRETLRRMAVMPGGGTVQQEVLVKPDTSNVLYGNVTGGGGGGGGGNLVITNRT